LLISDPSDLIALSRYAIDLGDAIIWCPTLLIRLV
jgi:hypothetical protein